MNINVSAVTSHFPNPQDGFTTTTSGSVSSGAAMVGLNSTGDYSNGDIVVLIIDPADPDKKQVFVGTMDVGGSQLTGVVWVGGTNQAHSSGATVVDYYDAAHIKMMTKGILVHADLDGTLKAGAVDNAAVLANNTVSTAKVQDAAITPVKWTNPYKFRVRRVAAQNTTGNTSVKINFDTEDFDTNNNFDSVTNFRYTAPVDGFYQFNAVCNTATNAGSFLLISLYKNGTTYQRGGQANPNNAASVTCSDLVQAVAGDYFEVFVFATNTVALDVNTGVQSCFSGYLVSQT